MFDPRVGRGAIVTCVEPEPRSVFPAAGAASRRGRLPAVYGVWLVGALVSQLGDAALYFALGWAASGIGGPAAGLVLSAIALPRTTLLLLGGVVGDRAGAARVLIAGDSVMLVVAAVLGVVWYAWPTPLPMLLAAGLIIGTVDAFYLPSLGSMPRRLVGDEQLSRAVAVRQSASQLVTMAGGPLGGAVVAFAGLAAAAWVDAVSFAVVLAVLVAIRPHIGAVATSRRTESVLVAARDGLRICRQTPGLGVALLLAAGAAGFVIPSTSLLVPLLARHNHWSASTAGLIVGAQGLGVIVSTLVVARHGSARRPGMAAVGGLATAAIGQVLVAVIQPSGLVVAAAVLIGLGSGTFVANLAPVLLGAAHTLGTSPVAAQPRAELGSAGHQQHPRRDHALGVGADCHDVLCRWTGRLCRDRADQTDTATSRRIRAGRVCSLWRLTLDRVEAGRWRHEPRRPPQHRGLRPHQWIERQRLALLRRGRRARPARVDRISGYRWYTAGQIHQARLIATLRRVSMPLAEMCAVLAAGQDTARAEQLLDVHLERLEHALLDGRRHLDEAREMLAAHRRPATRFTVCREDMAEALSAVHFAVSRDPDLPELNGVLLDYDGSSLRVVASDRYRLAVATVTTRDQIGPVAQAIATPSLTTHITTQAPEPIQLTFQDRGLSVNDNPITVIDGAFPDYRRLLVSNGATRISVTTAEVLNRLNNGPTRVRRQPPGDRLHEVSVVLMSNHHFQVLDEAHPDAIGFNREFLIEALAASAADELVLAIDAADGPLTITDPARPGHVNLLMPTRL